MSRNEAFDAMAISVRVLWYFWVTGARFIARGSFDNDRAVESSAVVEEFVREQMNRPVGEE